MQRGAARCALALWAPLCWTPGAGADYERGDGSFHSSPSTTTARSTSSSTRRRGSARSSRSTTRGSGPRSAAVASSSTTRDEDALVDALRLARGMTYKAALAGLAHGGGKSVLIRPQAALRSRRAVPRVRPLHRGPRAATTSPPRTAAPASRTWRSSARVTKHVTGVDADARRLGRSVAVHRARRPPRHRGVREVQARHATRSRASTSRCRASVTSATTCARSSTRAGAKLTVADVDPLKAERAQREFGATVVPLDDDLRGRVRRVRAVRARLGAQRHDHPAPPGARSSPAPRTTSSPSRATATTSTRAASSTRPTTRSTPAASSTSRRRWRATTRRRRASKTLEDLRHDLRDLPSAAEDAERADVHASPTSWSRRSSARSGGSDAGLTRAAMTLH